MLEKAGCQVIYGLENYKVHSKLCLITRKAEGKIEYITQIGTGNYNEKTSRLYTDLSLMTANVDIGMEAAGIFQALSKGEVVKETKHLLVAPKCLQSKVIEMIEEEIIRAKSGEDAYIGLKMCIRDRSRRAWNGTFVYQYWKKAKSKTGRYSWSACGRDRNAWKTHRYHRYV